MSKCNYTEEIFQWLSHKSYTHKKKKKKKVILFYPDIQDSSQGVPW